MADQPPWVVDDPAIVGQLRLLRRVPEFLVHSGAVELSVFDEREAGCGLSMTLWLDQGDRDDLLRSHADFGVICVTADQLREEGAIIARRPLVGNLNHCEIFPRLTGGARKRLKKAAKWVEYPTWVLPEHREDVEKP